MKALLLCAGRGSRLHPYTRNDSKVCLPFLNIPIAAYSLKLLEDIGVSRLLVNTHHQASQVVETIDFLLNPAKAGVQPNKHKAVHTGLKTADMRFAAERTFSRSASKPNLFSALPAQLYASTSSFMPASTSPLCVQCSAVSLGSSTASPPAKAGVQPEHNILFPFKKMFIFS